MIGSLSAAPRLFESCLRQPAHAQINICHWWELPTVAVFCGNVLIWNKTSNLNKLKTNKQKNACLLSRLHSWQAACLETSAKSFIIHGGICSGLICALYEGDYPLTGHARAPSIHPGLSAAKAQSFFSFLNLPPSHMRQRNGLTAAVTRPWPEQRNRLVPKQTPWRQLGLNQV